MHGPVLDLLNGSGPGPSSKSMERRNFLYRGIALSSNDRADTNIDPIGRYCFLHYQLFGWTFRTSRARCSITVNQSRAIRRFDIDVTNRFPKPLNIRRRVRNFEFSVFKRVNVEGVLRYNDSVCTWDDGSGSERELPRDRNDAYD